MSELYDDKPQTILNKFFSDPLHNPDAFETLTLDELLNLTPTPEDYRQEFQFRKGYMHGLRDLFKLFERRNQHLRLPSGHTIRQIKLWFDDVLWDWYNSAHLHSLFADLKPLTPPEFPEPWTAIRARILKRDGYFCQYCGSPANSVDHIWPVKGRTTYRHIYCDENLIACCKSCNFRKMNKTIYEFFDSNPSIAGTALKIGNKLITEWWY